MIGKQDYWAIVALDDHAEGVILRMSRDCQLQDIFQNGSSLEDAGFQSDWAKKLASGVYRLQLKPWGYEGFDGEIDCGIDVTKITALFIMPQLEMDLENDFN